MAVDLLRLRLQEDVAFVRTHDVSVYALYAYASLDVVGIEEHTGLFAVLERVGKNLCAVGTHLGIADAVVERVHTIDAACRIGAAAQIFKVEVVGLHLCAECNQHQGE